MSRSQLESLIARGKVLAARQQFSVERLCRRNPHQLRAGTSRARRKVYRCSRRAGKSYVIGIELLLCALAGQNALYVTLTRANAKDIIWDELCALNERYHLGGNPNHADLSIKFPGGGGVYLRGCNTPKETAKIRGKRYGLAVIDEMQSIPERILMPMIQGDLAATLFDYNGSLILSGTPAFTMSGFWYDAYSGKGGEYEVHRWTLRDNAELPFLASGDRSVSDALADVRREFGWTEDHPSYRREYLGEDVEDKAGQLFEVDEIDYYDVLPTGPWTTVLGFDLGVKDGDAIGIYGWRPHDTTVYLLEEVVHPGNDVTATAEMLWPSINRWNPISVVGDLGGTALKIGLELQRRHGLPVEPTKKHDKPGYIRLLNTALRRAEFKIPRDGISAREAKLVRRDAKALLTGELKEDKSGFHSDIWDCNIYGYRKCLAFLERPAPPVKTEEQRLEERLTREAERDWTTHEVDHLDDSWI